MRRPLSRVAVAILFSALLVVGAVLPAAADGPVVREPLVVTEAIFTDMCDFPVQVTFPSNNQVLTGWERPDGSFVVHITGVSWRTFTNLNTGYSLTENLSGPVMLIFYPDGSQYRHFPGPNALGDSPESDSPDFHLWGNLKVWIGTADWSYALHGRTAETCDLLDH